MRVWNQRETAPGVIELDSEAGIGFAMLTRAVLDPREERGSNAQTILVTLIRGPFRSLENRWRFSPDPGGCEVEFNIAYAFKSRILSAVLAANFDRAVMKLMGCFEDAGEDDVCASQTGSRTCPEERQDLILPIRTSRRMLG